MTLRSLAPQRGMWATYLFVAWTTFTTIDPITIGPLPFKPFLLGLALVLWYPHRSAKRIPLAVPVAVVAIGVPVVWSMVATFYDHPYAGLEPSPAELTIEHASRFVYLLIYFPLADTMLRGDGRRGLGLWVVPVLGLCALTWVLYILYHRLGVDIGATRVSADATAPSKLGPLAGIVEAPGEGLGRMFFSNQILLVPAIGVLMGLALGAGGFARRQRRWLLIALLFAISTLYPIHTRGLTIGVLIVLVVIAALSWRMGSGWPIVLVGLIAGLLFFTSIDPRATAFLKGDRTDLSIQQRVQQAPQLLDAWKERPLLGSGLGATLPSGYVRSAAQPFSFELTYHAILFQNGIIGLALILGVPLLAALRAVRAMGRLPRDERALAAGGVGGISGLVVAGATNPYLISTFGMLALAVTLAVCARAVHVARIAGEQPLRG
ncbi:MAG: O-antigen ligase family protein [Solirubrobacteraceae bacterium]